MQRAESSLVKRFRHFNLVSCGSLVTNVAVTALLIRIGTCYLLAQAIGIAPAFTSNYLISTHLVFSNLGQTQEAGQQCRQGTSALSALRRNITLA